MYATTGIKIATNWWPIEPKIDHWQTNFQNWSPASEMHELQNNHDITFVFIPLKGNHSDLVGGELNLPSPLK